MYTCADTIFAVSDALRRRSCELLTNHSRRGGPPKRRHYRRVPD